MTISSHYSRTNARLGLFYYTNLLLGLGELSKLKEQNSDDYPIKLNRIKRITQKLKDIHTNDSVKNVFGYDLNFRFVEGLVEEIDKNSIDASGLNKKVFPVIKDINLLFNNSRFTSLTPSSF